MHKGTHFRNGKSNYDLYADYENLKSALADATYDVKGRVGEIFTQSIEDMKTKSSDFKETLSDYIAKRPYKSIGIAVITGLFLGYLLRK